MRCAMKRDQMKTVFSSRIASFQFDLSKRRVSSFTDRSKVATGWYKLQLSIAKYKNQVMRYRTLLKKNLEK